jgi:hypothetical protein
MQYPLANCNPLLGGESGQKRLKRSQASNSLEPQSNLLNVDGLDEPKSVPLRLIADIPVASPPLLGWGSS